MSLERLAAKWRVDPADAAYDDAPVREPMRQAVKPMQRRAPTAEQKRERRAIQRGQVKTAGSWWGDEPEDMEHEEWVGSDGNVIKAWACPHCDTRNPEWMTECRGCNRCTSCDQQLSTGETPQETYRLRQPHREQHYSVRTAATDPGADYICKGCGAASPDGIGYAAHNQTEFPDPAPGCPGPHRGDNVLQNDAFNGPDYSQEDPFAVMHYRPRNERTSRLSPFSAYNQPSIEHTTITPVQYQPREVTDDTDFDPYLVTRCNDHGSKVVGDRESQVNYIGLAKAHHNMGPHDDEGMMCWSCCPHMYIAKPGERDSGRIASRHAAQEPGSYPLHTNDGFTQQTYWSPQEAWDRYHALDADNVKYGPSDGRVTEQAALMAHLGQPDWVQGYQGNPHQPGPLPQRDVREAMMKQATRSQMGVANSMGQILLQAGDQIRMPTGQSVSVKNVRRHETSRDHYYVDTDAGTTVVPWSTQFDVVRGGQNEVLPGPGMAGGNFGDMPNYSGNVEQQGQHQQQNVNPTGETDCPACKSKGSLVRRGGKFQCNQCGYTQNPQGGSGPQYNFSDATQQYISKINDPRSAIARRCAAVLAQPDPNQEESL